ncbi:hypothetical protein IEQ34_019591 [Dendrobium chrysotoxum]|uniref:Uncharacterized protein n=1 Tax=Dendrobium chrysotoxum TaxID=161865 RepID=A0AAV7G7S6_DENCH|nr:hypothetical protein IEQ34_019591 [Dendrobium chrysotoxum]
MDVLEGTNSPVPSRLGCRRAKERKRGREGLRGDVVTISLLLVGVGIDSVDGFEQRPRGQAASSSRLQDGVAVEWFEVCSSEADDLSVAACRTATCWVGRNLGSTCGGNEVAGQLMEASKRCRTVDCPCWNAWAASRTSWEGEGNREGRLWRWQPGGVSSTTATSIEPIVYIAPASMLGTSF